MAGEQTTPITRLLSEVASGHPDAMGQLVQLVYAELRAIASRQRNRHRPYETLHTTALVNEAFVKLAGKDGASWENRIHFLRAAARAMRDVLVDYARQQRAAKRGGGESQVPLHDLIEAGQLPSINVAEVLDVHDALTQLEEQDTRQARIVELRYFAGLSVPETAEVMEISPATVKREWAMARAWLRRALEVDS